MSEKNTEINSNILKNYGDVSRKILNIIDEYETRINVAKEDQDE